MGDFDREKSGLVRPRTFCTHETSLPHADGGWVCRCGSTWHRKKPLCEGVTAIDNTAPEGWSWLR